ncbi:hypothetical protein [Lactobacillus xylocopicola]|uniref:Uncharacterized protein n=1 Tax=Lactobacillus xylocopicola TaxID=2976676 RepID=A0ABM8BIV8_9LACO|nr:hypothetical protein [Lactobacillus xylocopicola]BDR61240.1 hypothetical protein KIM322_15010 [Lactobacillus xylocopicola]
MEKQAQRWYNRYSGTLVFFSLAVFISFNSNFFPYTIAGRLCALVWLLAFTFAMFTGEYLVSHVEVTGEVRYLQATLMTSNWLLAAVALVLFTLFFSK